MLFPEPAEAKQAQRSCRPPPGVAPARATQRSQSKSLPFNRTVKNKFPRQAGRLDASPREARNSPLYAPKVAVTPGRPIRMHNNRTIDFRLLSARSRLSARVKSFSSVPNTAEPGEIMIRFRIKSYPNYILRYTIRCCRYFFGSRPPDGWKPPGAEPTGEACIVGICVYNRESYMFYRTGFVRRTECF